MVIIVFLFLSAFFKINYKHYLINITSYTYINKTFHLEMEFHLNTGKINVIYPKAYLSLHGLFNSKNFPSLKM